MTVTVSSFRDDFSAFSDSIKYPDAMISFYINLGKTLCNPDRWSTLADYGIELFTAHNLTLTGQNVKVAANGGAPGLSIGPITSKSVDRVSASVDINTVTFPHWGLYNQTQFGIQFAQLANMAGMGGAQLGVNPLVSGTIIPFLLGDQ